MHAATATGMMLLLAQLPGCGEDRALPGRTALPAGAADGQVAAWHAVGRGPSGLALADLDGDGDLDLAVANETGGDVSVLLGDGDGGFRPAPGSPFPAGENPTQLAVGDYDRDGLLDLAIANHDTTHLSVLLARGGGAFVPAPRSPIQVPSRPHPHTIATADLDGDGDLDLVTDSWQEDRLLLLANDGHGSFLDPAIPLPVGDHPYSNALAKDVDGDGRADLMSPNLRGASVSVLLAGGAGRFAPAPGSPFAAGPSPFWIACGDVTGDRRPDLVVANYGGGLAERSDDALHLLPGEEKGRFGVAVRLPACWGPIRVELVDLDGDGTLDAALGCLGDHEVRFFRGGSGGLAPATWRPVPVGGGPGGIAVGDLDGDGRADLVATDGPGGRVLLRRAPAGPLSGTLGGAGTLLVGNKAEATVSLIDLPSGKLVATLPTGEGPHEVAVSPDGKLALVANYGTGPRPGGTLTVIDVPAARVAKTIDLGGARRPHGLAWLDGRRALVTAEASRALLVVDVEAGTVLQEIATGQEVSHMVAVVPAPRRGSSAAGPGNRRAFVANIGSGTVTALDLSAGKKLGDVETGAGAEGVDVTPDGRGVWVTNREAGTVTLVDAVSLEVLATVEVPGFPIRAKVTPDGRHVLVSNARSGDLAVIATAERKLERRVAFGLEAADTEGRLLGAFGRSSVPIGIVVEPDGRRAYVAHANADKIAVLDLTTWRVTATLTAGKEPDGMAYSPLTASPAK